MTHVEIGAGRFLIDGESRVLLCASLFPFRVPREEWSVRIRAVAALGYHCLDVYVPWNFHERERGVWDFSGERDLAAFLRLAAAEGMYVLARPGPYICSEWDGGGLPARLTASAPLRLRQNDPAFLHEVALWYAQVMPILAAHQASEGGPVIAVQLENELDFFDCDDPQAYVAALRDLASTQGIRVPLIACAGQGDIDRAGGWVEGVVPAVNLYPDDGAPDVEALAEHYAAVVRERGFPLIATETNRLHRTLKRLVVGGVKVLGPYLQASGWNFGYSTAVNNWGDLLGFLAHDYDFGGAVRPDGTERPDAADARRLAGTISALGRRLAEGVPAGPAAWVTGTGPAVHALSLHGGGEVLALSALGESAEHYDVGTADIFAPVLAHVEVPAGEGLLLVRDLPVAPGLEMTLCTAELVRWVPGDLSEIGLVARGVETVILRGECDVETEGVAEVDVSGAFTTVRTGPGAVTVRFGERRCRLVFEPAERVMPAAGADERSLRRIAVGEADALWAPVTTTSDPPALEAIGILEGAGRYSTAADLRGIRGLVLREAADVISVDFDDRVGQWRAHAGEALWVPSPAEDVAEVRITTRVWGHANFDDGRLPALRLGSRRGVTGVLAVRDEVDIRSGWTVAGRPYLGRDIAVGLPQPLAGVGGWMTAQFPQRTVYSRVMTRQADAALRFTENVARVDVLVNGIHLGAATPITDVVWLGALSPGDELCLEVIRTWGEPVGEPVLMLGEILHHWSVERQDAAVLSRSRDVSVLAPRTLPIPVRAGRSMWVRIPGADLEDDAPTAVVRLVGDDLHVTAMCGNELLGRLWLPSPRGATVKGGRGDLLIVPGAWRDRGLDLLLESTDVTPGALHRIIVGGPVDL